MKACETSYDACVEAGIASDGDATRDRFELCTLRYGPSQGFGDAVLVGLTGSPKSLPCVYFYDQVGSELFERICELPEYYLTRKERQILERHSADIVQAAGLPDRIVELGPGSARKSRLLLEAALRRRPVVLYVPIDVSGEFLEAVSLDLLEDFPRLEVRALAGEFREGLGYLAARGMGDAKAPSGDAPSLFLFMGSNIGNLEHEEAATFLGEIRAQMTQGDRLLLGADLKKHPDLLFAAYNDSKGITELFNKNVLRRINDELGGEFDLDAFAHFAPFVPDKSRIEMRLISRYAQSVRVGVLERSFTFQQGESILTEISQKYDDASIEWIAERAGLRITEAWHDPDRWFAVLLLEPKEGSRR